MRHIGSTINQTLMDQDMKVLWHPCTQMKDHETLPLIPIKKGEGVYLEDYDGNRYIDAVSSWWVNLFGHANPTINQAITAQLQQLEHVILAGFSHEPAIQLAEKLVEITPPGLERCFYADNGSSAIEAALKMSHHYWINQGQPEKKKFIYLSNSYHGETLGAMSVSGVPLYKATYDALLHSHIEVPSPDCFHCESGESWQNYVHRQFPEMLKTIETHAHETAAVIVEPLVQCAGHMRMYHSDYLKLLRKACDEHNIHLIADEIAVGFGRTGSLFACEQANITPDILCLSKGITGGYLPLAAVMTTNELYQAFYDDYESLKAFLHSHSYTGNPLACVAALATLSIFETDQTIEKNQSLSKLMRESVSEIEAHPHVQEIRQHGMILAIELCKDKKKKIPYPWQERRGLEIFKFGLTQGVLLRPLGNVIYFMPPYIISPQEIQKLASVSLEAIHQVTAD